MILHKVLITGDRNGYESRVIEKDLILVREFCQRKGWTPLIIVGGAPGVDTQARILAMDLNMHAAEIKALWDTRQRGAGPQRNDVMLALEPELCYAYHSNYKESKGTKHMVNACLKAGVPLATRGFNIRKVT